MANYWDLQSHDKMASRLSTSVVTPFCATQCHEYQLFFDYTFLTKGPIRVVLLGNYAILC